MIAVRVLTKEELAECVESRRAKLTRMAASMQDDPAGAEDVVQEAALNALKSVSVFRGDADVCMWFQRICLNSCYQALRRRTSTANLVQPLELEQVWRDPGYTVDQAAIVVALGRAHARPVPAARGPYRRLCDLSRPLPRARRADQGSSSARGRAIRTLM